MVVVGMMLSKAIRARGCSSCCRAKVKAGFPPARPGVRFAICVALCAAGAGRRRVVPNASPPKSTWRRTTSRHLTIVTTTATQLDGVIDTSTFT